MDANKILLTLSGATVKVRGKVSSLHSSPVFMYLTVSRHVLFVYLHQGS